LYSKPNVHILPPFWQFCAENIFEKNMTAERHKFTQTGNALDTHIFS